MKLDKYYFKKVNFISSEYSQELKSYLTAEKYDLYIINNKNVQDKSSFILEMSKIAPLQNEMKVSNNWDLLMDCFWQYTTMTNDTQIAIVLENTELFLDSSLKDLWFITDQFNMLSHSLSNPKTPNIEAKKLQLFLVGSGPNFE